MCLDRCESFDVILSLPGVQLSLQAASLKSEELRGGPAVPLSFSQHLPSAGAVPHQLLQGHFELQQRIIAEQILRSFGNQVEFS